MKKVFKDIQFGLNKLEMDHLIALNEIKELKIKHEQMVEAIAALSLNQKKINKKHGKMLTTFSGQVVQQEKKINKIKKSVRLYQNLRLNKKRRTKK